MNFARVARAPWVAATGSMRWLAIGIMVASIALAIVLRGTGGDATAAVFSLAPAVGLWWMFFLPNMLVLTLSARDLRLPGVRRDVVLGLGLYVVLTIVAPALLLGLVGANLAVALLVLALCALGCMLYATAPAWLALLAPLVMIAAPHLPTAWLPPAPGTAGFVRWAAAATLVLVLADVLRWRQLQRVQWPARGLRRAMIFGLNSNLRVLVYGDAGAATTTTVDAVALMRQRPDRLQREADLRGAGPLHPRRALRIALGGWYLPETWRSRLRRTTLALWPLVFALVVLGFVVWSLRVSDLAAILFGGPSLVLLDLYVVLLAVIMAVSMKAYVRHAWRRPNAQVPLLALLPGLGGAASARMDLLRVIVSKPLRLLVVALAILLGSAWYAGLPAWATVFLALVPVLWAGVFVVGVLQVLDGSGRVGRATFAWLLCPACGVLTCVGIVLPPLALGTLAPRGMTHLAVTVALAWLAVAIGLVIMGGRSWQRLLARPHAFLANAR